MKYTATLNGKQYEVELERIDAYEPMPRYGEAPAAAPAPSYNSATSAYGSNVSTSVNSGSFHAGGTSPVSGDGFPVKQSTSFAGFDDPGKY